MKGSRAYWTCQLLGWGGFSAVGMAMASQAVGWQAGVAVNYLLFFCYSVCLTHLLRQQIHRRRWMDEPEARRRVELNLGALAVGSAQVVLLISFNSLINRGAGLFRAPGSLAWTCVGVVQSAMVWTWLYAAITGKRSQREKEMRLQLAMREAELLALEAQVNPHFLFNCLNSIRALVLENPAQAQDMITRLANIMRHSLRADACHTAPLEAELEIVSDYLALESARFEDRLRVRFAIDAETKRVQIPTMLLQPLVENALKHGIARAPAGGEVFVRSSLDGDCLLIEVENTGQLADPKPGSTRVGLANTRERLRILYGARASLRLENRDGGRVAATVLIPRTA
jgi:anti-sigma regulatory factor (Ser/Thr protein kinase)